MQCGRPGFDPQVGKFPWRRKWQPTLLLLPNILRVETISANHDVAVIYLVISYGYAAQHV